MAPPNFFGQAKIRSKLWQNSRPRPWKAGGSPHRDDISMSESDVVIRGINKYFLFLYVNKKQCIEIFLKTGDVGVILFIMMEILINSSILSYPFRSLWLDYLDV